jgi:hypothetical protein
VLESIEDVRRCFSEHPFVFCDPPENIVDPICSFVIDEYGKVMDEEPVYRVLGRGFKKLGIVEHFFPFMGRHELTVVVDIEIDRKIRIVDFHVEGLSEEHSARPLECR